MRSVRSRESVTAGTSMRVGGASESTAAVGVGGVSVRLVVPVAQAVSAPAIASAATYFSMDTPSLLPIDDLVGDGIARPRRQRFHFRAENLRREFRQLRVQ